MTAKTDCSYSDDHSTAPASFAGFQEPQDHYYRLPHDWFAQMQVLRASVNHGRLEAALKILEFIAKYTWGRQRYAAPVHLLAVEFRRGRRMGRLRIDTGTGLALNSIRKCLKELVELGVIQKTGRHGYHLKIQQTQADGPASGEFAGFRAPIAAYFKVPKSWTDLTNGIHSAATILVVEYFMRHSWAFQNPAGVWLDAKDVRLGRQKQSGPRYDSGLGFDLCTIYRAFEDAVSRGLLVWTDRSKDGSARVYNIHLAGMPVSPTGEFLGQLPWEDPQEYNDWALCQGCGLPVCAGEPVDSAAAQPEGRAAPRDGDSECQVGTVAPSIGDCAALFFKETELKHEIESLESNKPPETPFQTDPGSVWDQTVSQVMLGPHSLPDFLKDLGIFGVKRTEILRHTPAGEALFGWLYYSVLNKSLNKNPLGYVIERLIAEESPPEDYLRLARIPLQDWVEIWKCRKELAYLGLDAVSEPAQAGAAVFRRLVTPATVDCIPPIVLAAIQPYLDADLVEPLAVNEKEDFEPEPAPAEPCQAIPPDPEVLAGGGLDPAAAQRTWANLLDLLAQVQGAGAFRLPVQAGRFPAHYAGELLHVCVPDAAACQTLRGLFHRFVEQFSGSGEDLAGMVVFNVVGEVHPKTHLPG